MAMTGLEQVLSGTVLFLSGSITGIFIGHIGKVSSKICKIQHSSTNDRLDRIEKKLDNLIISKNKI